MADREQIRKDYLHKLAISNSHQQGEAWQATTIYRSLENFPAKPLPEDPWILRPSRKEWPVWLLLALLAAGLLYVIAGEGRGNKGLIFFLVVLLLALPWALQNNPVIRFSAEGIWLYKADTAIAWNDLVASFIKEVQQESLHQSLVLHYWEEGSGGIRMTEIPLDRLASATDIAGVISFYWKPAT